MTPRIKLKINEVSILALLIIVITLLFVNSSETKIDYTNIKWDDITDGNQFITSTPSIEYQGEKMNINDGIVGKLGVNYKLNGSVPYMTCAYLNRTECDPNKRSDCKQTETCYLGEGQRRISCIGIYYYDPDDYSNNTSDKYLPVPENVTVVLGCFHTQGREAEGFCDNSKCRATTSRLVAGRNPAEVRQPDSDRGYGYCCCHSMNCNNIGTLELMNPFYIGEKGKNDDMRRVLAENLHIEVEKNSEKNSVDNLFVKVFLWLGFLLSFCMITSSVSWVMWMRFRRKPHIRRDMENCQSRATGLTASRTTSLNNLKSGNNTHNSISEIELDDLSASIGIPANLQEGSSYYFPVEDLRNISEQVLIARGRFGAVYRGTLTNRDGTTQVVAIKKHRRTEYSSFRAEKSIYDELAKLPKWYPSVLKAIACEQIGNEYWVVTEFHQRLSLYEILKKNVISISTALRIIVTMLDGLQFLHDERPFYFDHVKPTIIHRDIKSKNILIRNDMTAVISDFGLARSFTESMQANSNSGMLTQVGTRRYMSPEVLEGATEFTTAAFKQMDVYAMGLVMWEVLSRTKYAEETVPNYKMPYEDEIGNNPPIGAIRAAVVTNRLRPAFRSEIMKSWKTREMKSITEDMWDAEAYGRITAGCAYDRAIKTVLDPSIEPGVLETDSFGKIIRLSHYYTNPDRIPHPSPDPFLDTPAPPAIRTAPPLPPTSMMSFAPVRTERDALLPDNEDPHDLGLLCETDDEVIFDTSAGRFVNVREAELLRQNDRNEDSTLTPEDWSSSSS